MKRGFQLDVDNAVDLELFRKPKTEMIAFCRKHGVQKI